MAVVRVCAFGLAGLYGRCFCVRCFRMGVSCVRVLWAFEVAGNSSPFVAHSVHACCPKLYPSKDLDRSLLVCSSVHILQEYLRYIF